MGKALGHACVLLFTAAVALGGASVQDPVINEWVANHAGAGDPYEFVEIFAEPLSTYSTYSVLVLEGDSSSPGVIDVVIPLGTTSESGIWTSDFFVDERIESGTQTLALVEGFTGSRGQDIDFDDDGVADVTPWTRLVDCLGVRDGGAGDVVYCAAVLGAGFDGAASHPGGASRIPDGTDSDSAADWVRNDFDGEGLPGMTGTPVYGEAFNTPGASNAVVPGPAARLQIDAPQSASGGSAFALTVTAVDSRETIATGYTGTVAFTSSDGAAILPENYTFTADDAGVRAFSATLNTAGMMTITATDTGSGTVTGSTPVEVTGDTTTLLTSTVNPSTVGQPVTFTATVTSSTAGSLTGSVSFRDGEATLGTVTLAGGSASFTISSLSAGTHPMTAQYEGSATFAGSTSAPLNQVVNAGLQAPPAFVATATSTSDVELTWGAVAGATAYEVYRSTSIAGGSTFVGSTAATSYLDSGRTPETTYLYTVRTISGDDASPFSTDLATTTVFTDAALDGSIRVKAVHVLQLRSAVNAVRAAAGLPGTDFSHAPVAAGTVINRGHLVELRQALAEARSALTFPAISYTDMEITAGTTLVKAAHWMELRAGVQ